MTPQELQKAIIRTLTKITRTKDLIEAAVDPREARRLMLSLKELQYLQLWHLDQLKHMDE